MTHDPISGDTRPDALPLLGIAGVGRGGRVVRACEMTAKGGRTATAGGWGVVRRGTHGVTSGDRW